MTAKRIIAALAASAALLAGVQAARAGEDLVIDTFDTSQSAVADGVAPGTAVGTADIDLVSHHRSITVEAFGDIGSTGRTTANVTGGELTISDDDGVTGSYTIAYPGLNWGQGVNLTEHGNGFKINVSDVTAPFTVTIYVSSGDRTSTMSKIAASSGQLVFPYSQFTGDANFGAADSIEITFFDQETGGRAAFESFRTLSSSS